MRTRTKVILLIALSISLLAASSASAAVIGIYRNNLETLSQRSELVKINGRACARGGIEGGLRVLIGEQTEACSLRTPVVGRDLEIVADQRLLGGTPKKLQYKAYIGVELRAGGAAKYQYRVFPRQHKVQLLKITPEKTKYLGIEKDVGFVRGVGQLNTVRLRVANITSGEEKGHTRLIALLGNEKIVEAIDPAGGELQGRASAVVVGSVAKNAKGTVAKFEKLILRVPSPF
ncbi:MAG: hypothetical protein R2725_16555 [Solirubrobacterales bacterium]